MSRNINCDYCGEYLCSDYCDLEERVAAHYPGCMQALIEERDQLRSECHEHARTIRELEAQLGKEVLQSNLLRTEMFDAKGTLRP